MSPETIEQMKILIKTIANEAYREGINENYNWSESDRASKAAKDAIERAFQILDQET